MAREEVLLIRQQIKQKDQHNQVLHNCWTRAEKQKEAAVKQSLVIAAQLGACEQVIETLLEHIKVLRSLIHQPRAAKVLPSELNAETQFRVLGEK